MGMAAECGLMPAWGETDAYANRYHEQPVLSKQAGASPLVRHGFADGSVL
jgi:hypothetical protein